MTSNNIPTINLWGAQKDLWRAFYLSTKNVLAVAHVGSGKSFLCRLLLTLAAADPKMHKGKDIVYVAPSNGMVSRIMWGDLKKECMKMYGLRDERDINNSNKTIAFPNGIKIHCLSAETGLKGINASLVICDEAAEFSEESLQELSNRIRPTPGDKSSGGRMILISTPEGKNQFYKMFQEAQAHPEDWIVFHLGYKQMKSQFKDWIEKQRYLLSPLKFARDLECNWGSVEDQFFMTWNKNYLSDEWHNKIVDRQTQLYSFHDFNKKRMTAIIAQVVGMPGTSSGKIEILKSYAIESCSTEQLAIKIKSDWSNRSIHCIMDMSGAQTNRDTTSAFGVTDKTILEKHGFKIINTRNGNPLISDTDNSANAFISQGRLLVPYYEKDLIEALETYHFEDASRKALVKYKEANLMHIDGLGDCLRYGIHHLFPMKKEVAPTVLPTRFGMGVK